MATLVYSDVDGVDRSFALGNEPVTIGRAPECTIRSEDPRVSRMHARFYIDQGVLWVEDAGSSNGIYVGPNKVQRAPVPTGEIILVGSLMMRLLPASGTLPPPMGLHGTLATWLELERKGRIAIEDERDAFARRVGELHQELRTAKEAVVEIQPAMTAPDGMTKLAELAELTRAKEDAEGHAAQLEHAHGEVQREAQTLRESIDKLKKTHQQELEAVRLELAKAKEQKMVAEAQGGMAVVAQLAETDLVIANLQKDLATAKRLATAPPKPSDTSDLLAAATARADKAEKELAAAQIRAQGAERNLAGANTGTAKAESRAAELATKLAEADERAKLASAATAAATERIAELEARVGAGDAPLAAAEARAKQLAGDLATAALAADVERDKLAALEKQVAEATARATAAEVGLAAATTAAATASATVGDAGKRAAELEAKIATLAGAEAAIGQAIKQRDLAVARAELAEKAAAAASTKVDESDKRSTAAETMAKAMAKDVAEALRRAAEADSRAKGLARDIASSARAAEEAEAKAKTIGASVDEVQARATAAEATAQKAVADAEAAAKKAIAAAVAERDAQKTELTARLESLQRELAAERSTSIQIIDGKSRLEREVAGLPALRERAEAAEAAKAQLEIQLEQLQERVDDLESNVAVAETAAQATSSESKAKVTTIEQELAQAKAALQKQGEAAESLRVKLRLVEGEVSGAERKQAEAEAFANAAKAKIAELETLAGDRGAAAAESRQKLDEAIAHVKAIEERTEGLSRSAEAADLAIGRAGGLQRQLDEAISKHAWLERELASAKSGHDREAAAALAAAEARAQTAEEAARTLEQRAQTAEQRAQTAERRATEAEARPVAPAPRESVNLDLQKRIQELEREVAKADNVRSFAAETEKEIAQLQRDLRDARSKLTQTTLERDRFESELRDSRNDDGDTTNRRSIAAVDNNQLVEADQRYQQIMRDNLALKKAMADLEARLAQAQERLEDQEEATATGSQLPMTEIVEHVSILEESIDSLRANMRAASDETAMMDQTDSVVTVSSAVSQAAEHIERARSAVRALLKSIR